tara:strand:+ start:355 stop:501 length:147 start_codon:yes stop_codon:yes gene_type:complete
MVTINVNGVSYSLPIEKLSVLVEWLNAQGAIKVLENTTDPKGRQLLND